MPNRWLPVVGGILMNLALGSLYAWSVFVLPLEKEFGWTRAQTSWVFTIAIVFFALSFIVAGRIQDLKGPRLCAAIGGVLAGDDEVLETAGFESAAIPWHELAFRSTEEGLRDYLAGLLHPVRV